MSLDPTAVSTSSPSHPSFNHDPSPPAFALAPHQPWPATMLPPYPPVTDQSPQITHFASQDTSFLSSIRNLLSRFVPGLSAEPP
jgi:hypothetical protein